MIPVMLEELTAQEVDIVLLRVSGEIEMETRRVMMFVGLLAAFLMAAPGNLLAGES